MGCYLTKWAEIVRKICTSADILSEKQIRKLLNSLSTPNMASTFEFLKKFSCFFVLILVGLHICPYLRPHPFYPYLFCGQEGQIMETLCKFISAKLVVKKCKF